MDEEGAGFKFRLNFLGIKFRSDNHRRRKIIIAQMSESTENV